MKSQPNPAQNEQYQSKTPREWLTARQIKHFIPSLPLVLWMLLVTIFLGIAQGQDAKSLISTFNYGWGYAAGEFALILIPAFILAGCIARTQARFSPLSVVAMSPILGANMICPDTAHAALSPMGSKSQLKIAFGAYSGFKLLYPAGPLIIATSLGSNDSNLMIVAASVFIPVWIIGLFWAHFFEPAASPNEAATDVKTTSFSAWIQILPFAVLISLVITGFSLELSSRPFFDFATNPKGALLIAAIVAMACISTANWPEILDQALRRAADILLIIGMASALSAVLIRTIPIETTFDHTGGPAAIIILFGLTAIVKLLQGSSMATFAAIGPLALPIVSSSGLPPHFAVIAICLGSFIAVLPNDSFYWIVRDTTFTKNHSQTRVISILAGGSVLQAIIGLIALFAIYFVTVST